MFEDRNIGELCEKCMLSKLNWFNARDQLNVLYQACSCISQHILAPSKINQQKRKILSIKDSLHSIDNFIGYNGSLSMSATVYLELYSSNWQLW